MSITEPAQMRLAAEAGLQLIPLHRWDATSTDRAGKTRQDGKRPLDMDWPRRPYSNDEVLARAERDGLNVGVRLTAELLVVDVDPRNMPQGRNTLAELSSVIGADLSDWLPRTETGSGGLHLWMTKPADVAVVDSLSDFPGVEFKTRGRQVVAPGSIHPNGQPYRLNDPLEDLRAPDPIPLALLDLIARKPSRYSAGDDAGDAQLDAEEVEAVLAAMGEVPDYDDWLKVLMACHAVSAGVALAECQEWSYEGDAELVADKWRGFGAKGNGAGRVGWGTLKRLAKQYGGDKAETVCDRIERGDPGDDFMDDVEPEAEPSTAETAELPSIRVREGGLVEMVDAAKEALFAHAGGEVLQRHGALVRPLRLGDRWIDGAVKHHAGATILTPITEPWLTKRMAQSARWFRVTHQKSKEGEEQGKAKATATDPPMKVAKIVLADQGSWPFYHVRGLVAAPTIDVGTGQIVDTPGINPETGLLAAFDADAFPRIERNVGLDGAKVRLERVEQALFRDMPFVDGPSRAVAMSALVTALVRPTMRAAPMHLFDAAMPGTGKSKMASVVGVVATGVEPSASAWATNEEENEKRLAALLRRGAPVVLFDNVDSKRGDRIGGNMLNIVLTQDPASIRVLGKTEEETLNTRVMMLATGNNIAVSGDCCRRAVKCRLDAKVSEPERRRFDWDPVQVAKDGRPRLVADLLEALSAYISSGRPTDPAPLGSFEDWTVVRGLLLWCGFDDPADTLADVKATDAARGDLTLALETWWMAFGEEWVTAAQVEEFMADKPDLEEVMGRELLEGQEALLGSLLNGRLDKNWIGKALLETQGVAAGEFYLEAEKRSRASVFRVTRHP